MYRTTHLNKKFPSKTAEFLATKTELLVNVVKTKPPLNFELFAQKSGNFNQEILLR
jgi:hypothetical protein